MEKGERGAVAIITVIVLLATSLVLTTGLTFLVFSESAVTSLRARSTQTFSNAEACVEEALLRLMRNSGYTGGTIAAGGVSCSVAVTDLGSGTRRIDAQATTGSIGRKIQAQSQLSTVALSGRSIQQISLTSWEEKTE